MVFMHPVPGPITSGFGPRKIGFHNGIDYGWLYADPDGSKIVYAPASGVVTVAWNALVGNYISLPTRHGILRLAHFASIRVKTGQTVVQGVTVLGVMGRTGLQAQGVHLHVDLYQSGVRVDPEPYFTIPYRSPGLAGGDGTPIKTRRKGNTVTLFHTGTGDNRIWALAGDSPGTPANWRETRSQDFANQLAAQHGPSAELSTATWDNWKRDYLAPLVIAGGGGVQSDVAVLDAIAKVPTAEQNGAAARDAIVKP